MTRVPKWANPKSNQCFKKPNFSSIFGYRFLFHIFYLCFVFFVFVMLKKFIVFIIDICIHVLWWLFVICLHTTILWRWLFLCNANMLSTNFAFFSCLFYFWSSLLSYCTFNSWLSLSLHVQLVMVIIAFFIFILFNVTFFILILFLVFIALFKTLIIF